MSALVHLRERTLESKLIFSTTGKKNEEAIKSIQYLLLIKQPYKPFRSIYKDTMVHA